MENYHQGIKDAIANINNTLHYATLHATTYTIKAV
jgi:uncharacterized protein (DUF2164 family)